MKNLSKTKKLLVISGLLISVGMVFAIVGVLFGGRASFYIDNSGIHSYAELRRESESASLPKTKLDAFENLNIEIYDMDLRILPSDGFYIEYMHDGRADSPAYSVNSGTLTLKAKEKENIFSIDLISIFPPTVIGMNTWGNTNTWDEMNYVNLYVPADAVFKEVSITNGYGDITFTDMTADRFTCTLGDGDVEFKNVNANTITLANAYGDTSVENLKGEKIIISSSDGDIHFNTLECENLEITNSYGDIEIQKLDALNSVISLSDGDFEGALGNISSLELANSYGDIGLRLLHKLDDYNIDLRASYGDIRLPDIGSISSDDDTAFYQNKKTDAPILKIHSSDGDINITD